MGEAGSGPASRPQRQCAPSQCTAFMACPLPFSKVKMIVAVLISLPTRGPVSARLLSPLAKRLFAQRNCLRGFLGDSSESNTSNGWEEKLTLRVWVRWLGPANLTDNGQMNRRKDSYIHRHISARKKRLEVGVYTPN